MTDKVRFAVIGAGHPHGRGFRDTLSLMPEIEVVAIYDKDPDWAIGAVQDEFRKTRMYGDLPTLLEEQKPEAALITLPNADTPAAIVNCAEAGVHVYAEKPCALNAGDFLPAMAAIQKAGVQFSTGYLRRSSAAGKAIRNYVNMGILGHLISIEARWITTSPEVRDPSQFLFDGNISGGGILHWLGCHWIDFMRWCTSAEVTEVSAILDTLNPQPITVEDTAVLSLRYEGGAAQKGGMLGTLHSSYVTDAATDQLFFGLRGTDGWIEWEKSGPELIVHSRLAEWESAPTRVIRFNGGSVGGYGGGAGMSALRHFIASFRNGVAPLYTPEDALKVLEVLDAAHESSDSGNRIHLGRA